MATQNALAQQLHAVIKAYDIRGTVPDQFNEDVAQALGWAAGTLWGSARGFVVGRDMRVSSEQLSAAFISGLQRAGCHVIDVGLAATDQLYFASGIFDRHGAMFTASHNPGHFNGIKLCGPGAAPISRDTGLNELSELAQTFSHQTLATGMVERRDVLEQYAQHVRSFVDVRNFAPISVAVDAANGMAGHVWPSIAAGLPIDTAPLYFELDGTFPNHPANPLEPSNLRDLAAEVTARQLPVGLAFDGDADRVFVVDETGAPVSASLVGALLAHRLLQDHPNEMILHNLICSRVVAETIERSGGTPVRTRVGHTFIKQTMAETNAIMAIEHSGHYYYRENYRADSATIVGLVILEALGQTGESLSKLLAPFDRYAQSGEQNFEIMDSTAALSTVRQHFTGRGKMDDLDGLTVSLKDAWLNLRPSNTEPLVRLNVEAPTREEVVGLVDEVAELIAVTRD